MPPARRLYQLVPVLAFLVLSGCDYPPPNDKPQSVSDLGIATPDHPISDPGKLYAAGPMQVPVPSPAVSRSTDAGAQDEGGVVEPKE